jgi:hypothetical protein
MEKKNLTPEQIYSLELINRELESKNITLISEQWLKDHNFQQIENFKHYRLEIPTDIIDNKRSIECSIMPHDKWIAYYQVNGNAGSKTMTTTEEIKLLHRAVSGNDIQTI